MKLLAPSMVALLAAAGACSCDMTHVRQGGRVESEERPPHRVRRSTVAPPRGSAAPPPSAFAVPTSASVPAPSSSGSSAPTSDGGVPSGCDAPDVQREMAEQLLPDKDFHLYICEEEPCSVQEFLDGLRFSEVVLRDAPRTAGCIVGPLHEAMTRIYGVFLLRERTPNLLLIHMGVDVSVDDDAKKPGFKDLVATERLDLRTTVTYRYVWRDRGYLLESTTEEVAR